MFEQMSVGVKMAIDGNPDEQLNLFRQSVKEGAQATQTLTKKLALLNEQFLKVSEILTKLNPALKEFSDTLALSADGGKNLNRTFGGLNRRLDGMADRMAMATRKASMLADGLEGVAAASGVASAAASAGFGVAGFAAGRAGGHGGGGVHVKGVHFGGLGFTGAAIGAGIGLMALHSGYEESKKYQQVLAQFSLMNMLGASPQQADAWVKAQNIHGVSNIQMLDALTDSANATKSFEDAKILAPYLAKIEYANGAIFAGTNVPQGRTENQNMLRVAEQRSGSKDPRLLIPALQYMQQVKASSGGRVNASDYQQLAKASGIMGKTSSNDFFYYGLEPIVQEQGAFRTGTQLRGVGNALVAGRMTTASAKDFQALDLIKPGYAEFNKIGMIKRIKPGGIKDSSLVQGNFEQWVYQDYLPALAKKGITSSKDIQRHVAIDFTNTDQTLVGLMIMQKEKILANIEANKRGARIGESTLIASGLAAGKEKDLEAAFSKLKQTLGEMATPQILQGMQGLTNFLNEINTVLQTFQNSKYYVHDSALLHTPSKNKSPAQSIVDAFLNKGSLVSSNTEPSAQPAQHAQLASQPVMINVDGRELMQTLLPHLNQSLYHTQLQQSNTFMPGMTPTPVGSGAPYRS
jgi:hypothetical protein